MPGIPASPVSTKIDRDGRPGSEGDSFTNQSGRAAHTPILAYHHVCANLYPSIARVTPKRFVRQLDLLKEAGCNCPTLSNYFESEHFQGRPGCNPEPGDPTRAVILTFDDALNCFYDNALRALLDRRFSATVFVVTDYVGRPSTWDYFDSGRRCSHMDWPRLRELVDMGIEIGSHSCSHHDLRSLEPEAVRREMKESKRRIEDKLGVAVRFFSYPFGRMDAHVAEQCQSAGYSGAVSMRPESGYLSPYQLGRSAVYLFDGERALGRKLTQPGTARLEAFKLRFINACSLGTILLNRIKKR